MKLQQRRKLALARLEAQMKLGYKNSQDREGNNILPISLPLTEKDVTRIKKEIEVLKSKI